MPPSSISAAPASNDPTIARLEAVLDRYQRQPTGAAPGMAVAVMAGDRTLLRTGRGLASIELGVRVTPTTAFRIASVSKQFTCAAILMLVRAGKLDIDADIRDLLPGCLPGLGTVARGALTPRLMMHMASGLRDFLTMLRAGGVELGQRLSPAQIDAMVARHAGLNFQPNGRFLYCNTNYLLLGQLVERISGQNLADFLRQAIFQPLGMAATRHTPDPDAVEPGLATPYMLAGADPRTGPWRRAHQRLPLGGEGGLVSTLDDLMRWAQFLRRPSPELAWLPGQLRTILNFGHGHPNIYARGQEVLRYRGLTLVGHGGLWPGFRTEFVLVPERDWAVIVIANESGLNPHGLSRRLIDALLGSQPEPAREKPPAPGLYFNDGAGLALEIGGPNPAHDNAPTLNLFSGLAPLRAEDDGWFEAEAGAIVLKVKQSGRGIELIDDAGARFALDRIERAAQLPDGLAGAWHCRELGATWTIARPDKAKPAEASLSVAGPVIALTEGWLVKSLRGDWVEIVAPSPVFPASFTARLGSDGAGRHLLVHTARARSLRFDAV